MFENLDIFRMAQSMAVHAGKRQALIAQNIANADTPGYKPLEITSFSEVVQRSNAAGPTGQSHLPQTVAGLEPFESGDGSAPNGNAVSIETEMVKAVESKQQHDQALAIYKSSMSILRSAIGRR